MMQEMGCRTAFSHPPGGGWPKLSSSVSDSSRVHFVILLFPRLQSSVTSRKLKRCEGEACHAEAHR
jgi:hypothetical protein